MTLQRSIEEQCKAASLASSALAVISTETKNAALTAMAKAIIDETPHILSENQKDLESGKINGVGQALLDRLTLTQQRLAGISEAILEIVALKDPIGELLAGWTQPNGLNIYKVRVPLGTIGIIYEARPNVTADAISLALKTGNSVVLRGSSSAYHSNRALASVLGNAAGKVGIPTEAIQLLDDVSREGVTTFIQMRDYLSVVIPRGGADLIRSVTQNSKVPTIETGVGNCHVFVDQSADLEKANNIIFNAKTHRPAVCNACETLLVHRYVADIFLPVALQRLSEAGVEIRGCETTQKLYPSAKPASELDWDTEFADLILAVRVVDSADEAMKHIQKHGSKHTEAIVSNDYGIIETFLNTVDAAAVMVNASTRFTDGGQFGFGAEMGISTQKLHARGPMGLAELTTYKYIVKGDGHIRH